MGQAYHKKRFMSSLCSIPALQIYSASRPKATKTKSDAQSLRLVTQSCLGIIVDSVILLNEPDTNDEDICLSKHDALFLGTRFELGDTDRVCRPRIIRQRPAVAGVVLDEVKEDTASADAMLRPI